MPGTELAVSLARHGLSPTTNALPIDGVSVDDVLLNHANETGAYLLVMGAYGHSRIRVWWCNAKYFRYDDHTSFDVPLG